jgi:hypothetical protein
MGRARLAGSNRGRGARRTAARRSRAPVVLRTTAASDPGHRRCPQAPRSAPPDANRAVRCNEDVAQPRRRPQRAARAEPHHGHLAIHDRAALAHDKVHVGHAHERRHQ